MTVYARASAKLKVRPWIAKNSKHTLCHFHLNLKYFNLFQNKNQINKVGMIKYYATEHPVVFFSTLLAGITCKL